jgi:hypothetical protein
MKILSEHELHIVSGGDYNSGKEVGEQVGKCLANCVKAVEAAYVLATIIVGATTGIAS